MTNILGSLVQEDRCPSSTLSLNESTVYLDALTVAKTGPEF